MTSAVVAAFDGHEEVFRSARGVLEPVIEQMVELVGSRLVAGGKVLAIGNGGSATDAQHLASELVGRFGRTGPGWRAIALTTDGSVLTSLANDLSFEQVFAHQVEALGDPGDVLVALSTSGRSPNVLAAVRSARSIGCAVVSLSGAGGDELAALSDIHLAVPSRDVPRVQELHGVCLHALVSGIEARAAVPPGRRGS